LSRATTKLSPLRDLTDESLRAERGKVDQSVAERTAAEEEARRLVERARENADSVLEGARDKADDQLAATGDVVRTSLVHERNLEDEALRAEREVADDTLRNELAESQSALAKLFPLEREATDRTLLTERARSDDAVSNRDEFLGIVSHDLRNLLGGIVVSVGLLAKQHPENGEETARIRRYAARMNRLIGDLLDVASIEAGKLAVAVTRGDTGALVAEAVDLFRGPARTKGITLVATPVAQPLFALFDHDRMLQVLANLLTNALKFGAKGDTVTVGCEDTGKLVTFSVRDEGPGIPADMLEVVFERFCQIGKNDRRGLGLGLHIARRIVEAHGGTICVKSALGGPSTFVFTVPAA
jgi:signal transduction histidine kinase